MLKTITISQEEKTGITRIRKCFNVEIVFLITVTGALSGDLGDLGAHGTGTANSIALGGTANGGGLNGLGAGAFGIKGAGGGAVTGALIGTGGFTGLGGLAGATGIGGQMGTVGGMSEIHASGGAYGLGIILLIFLVRCNSIGPTRFYFLCF